MLGTIWRVRSKNSAVLLFYLDIYFLFNCFIKYKAFIFTFLPWIEMYFCCKHTAEEWRPKKIKSSMKQERELETETNTDLTIISENIPLLNNFFSAIPKTSSPHSAQLLHCLHTPCTDWSQLAAPADPFCLITFAKCLCSLFIFRTLRFRSCCQTTLLPSNSWLLHTFYLQTYTLTQKTKTNKPKKHKARRVFPLITFAMMR